MYPGVIIDFDDQSDISSLPIAEVSKKPLYGAIFTSDKGTEEWTKISGKDFFTMYGKNISFSKHGQPLLQAAMSINAGAELLCKRLVADDATLANISLIATVQTKTVKVNVEVADSDSKEDPVGPGTPGTGDITGEGTTGGLGGDTSLQSSTKTVEQEQKTVTVSYEYYKVSNITAQAAKNGSHDQISDMAANVVTEAKKYVNEENNKEANKTNGIRKFLLYTIVDIGRGVSNKRIRIIPNYKVSKSLDYTLYTLSILENNSEVESLSFSANPNLVVNGQNISLQSMINTNSTQLYCIENNDEMEAFASVVEGELGLPAGELLKNDPIFLKSNKGADLAFTSEAEDKSWTTTLVLDTKNGKDLQANAGHLLDGGSNGEFGDAPSKLMADKIKVNNIEQDSPYCKVAKAALDGTFSKIIFNVDQYKIDAWVDANYPPLVKKELETLAAFREDFMYFRDQGLGVTSLEAIAENCRNELKSMFCATYPQSYDIIDPYTRKQIPVTIGYDIAQLLVGHVNRGAILPCAGIKYGFVIDSAIYGTVSYIPTICPDDIGGNEKEKLEDLKVNYASYIDNQLVVETLYTSQDKETQWSYINNVMGIQQVVKAIRTRCPVIRYTFIAGEDLERYRADVNAIINQYSSNYIDLSLEYVADATYAANKIFYAVLKVRYKDFIQTEWFKITALSTVTTVTE